jgi:hypothetical protein
MFRFASVALVFLFACSSATDTTGSIEDGAAPAADAGSDASKDSGAATSCNPAGSPCETDTDVYACCSKSCFSHIGADHVAHSLCQ